MLVFAVDTATTLCSCGFYDNETQTMLAERSDDIGRGHAEHLMGQIDDVLADAKLSLRDIEHFVACVGPGSFTGIRVGVSAVRGFALALGKPCGAVTTLQAIAHDAGDACAVALSAGRGQIYLQHFVDAVSIDEAVMVDPADAQIHDGAKLVTGNGAALLTQVHDTDRPAVHTAAATGSLASIATLGAANNQVPSPLYIRGADAKVQAGFALPRAGASA